LSPPQRPPPPGPLPCAARGLGLLGSLAMAQRRAAAQSATRRAARRSVGGGGGRTQRRGTSQSGRGAVCGVSDRLCPEHGVALWGVTGFPVTPSRRACARAAAGDRKSTRLNFSHQIISYAVFCLKKKKQYYTDAST